MREPKYQILIENEMKPQPEESSNAKAYKYVPITTRPHTHNVTLFPFFRPNTIQFIELNYLKGSE